MKAGLYWVFAQDASFPWAGFRSIEVREGGPNRVEFRGAGDSEWANVHKSVWAETPHIENTGQPLAAALNAVRAYAIQPHDL